MQFENLPRRPRSTAKVEFVQAPDDGLWYELPKLRRAERSEEMLGSILTGRKVLQVSDRLARRLLPVWVQLHVPAAAHVPLRAIEGRLNRRPELELEAESINADWQEAAVAVRQKLLTLCAVDQAVLAAASAGRNWRSVRGIRSHRRFVRVLKRARDRWRAAH
jgi:hypothetical protein